MDPTAIMVLVTVPDQQTASALADSLVQNRLAACVQISGPIRSVYHWKGEIQNEPEFLLFIKTTAARFPELKDAIIKQHPYEVPEIVALPITMAHEPYIEWLQQSTS